MKKLNRKGYMTIEIILASVITFVIAFFLIDLTMKFADTTDNSYVDIVLVTDRALIMKNIKENIESDMNSNGKIKSVSCTSNICTITMYNNVVRKLSVSGNIVKYTDSSNSVIYSKEIDSSLSNISLTGKISYDYVFFKIDGENIFVDQDYGMNIFVNNG